MAEKQGQWLYGSSWIQMNSLPFQLHAQKQITLSLLVKPLNYYVFICNLRVLTQNISLCSILCPSFLSWNDDNNIWKLHTKKSPAYLFCLNQQHFVTGRKDQLFYRLFNLEKILYTVLWIFNNKRIHKAILETKNNEINTDNQSQAMHSILSLADKLRLITTHCLFLELSMFTLSRMPCLLTFI